MTDEKQSKLTMEEALDKRAVGVLKETPKNMPTQTTLDQKPPQVEPILAETRDRLEKQYQEELSPPMETTILSQPETEKQETPASNTDLQPVTDDSTQGSQEQTPQRKTDNNLRRLIDFVNGPEFSGDWVHLHLGHISRIPSVIPSITIWQGVSFEEVVGAVYVTMKMAGYVENTWPILKIVMGSSRDNTEWTAGVLCTMALFDTIKILPTIGR